MSYHIAMIIDFHTHTFPDKIAVRAIQELSHRSHSRPFTDGRVSSLVSAMKKGGVTHSVNLPVATSPAQGVKINRQLVRNLEASLKLGVIPFGCIHPALEDYRSELALLKNSGIKGIKLHPAYQDIDIDDPKMLRIMDAASDLDMIILAHAGIDIGIHHHNYASVSRIIHVIETVRPTKLVLAHMGGWGCWKEVESDLAGAPVWLDTAFSIGPIPRADQDPTPPLRTFNLTDSEFVRLSRKHGSRKILFATDSPWADQQDYVSRICRMPLTQEEKDAILWINGAELLGI